jgi:hypothetical protein
MRMSLFLLTILAIAPAVGFGQADAPNATQNRKSTKQHMIITGCLTGKHDQYRFKDEKGKTVIPYSATVDLDPYVGKSVTLVGDQSATPSTDPGMGRPLPLFKVAEARPGSGTCK